MLICLFAPQWPDLAGSPLPADLLTIAPRITIAADVVWADAHGLPACEIALRLVACAAACGVADVRAAVACTAVAAELGARIAQAHTVVVIDADERSFISPFPLTLFSGHERLLSLLEGVGVRTCGELAALEREAVEVRFGAEAVDLWQWSRAQDMRRVFSPVKPERLHASTDFIDYVVTDPERLVFVTNALFGNLCDQLRTRGEHARHVLLTLSLGNRTSWQRTIRPARPTASRAVWLRLASALLERLTVPDAVTGVQIEVTGTEAAAAVQGDLFDAGFATAASVDSAVARLREMQGNIIVQPRKTAHPLAEKWAEWIPAEALSANLPSSGLIREGAPELNVQLLEEPREVLVETVNRRDHVLPIRYRDGDWKQLLTVAGPDRISGGKWDQAYAREYFRAVTVEGQLVWLYREAREDRWYLHGSWD